MSIRLRTVIGSIFLFAQLGAIVYAQFTPRRYFCWAPNDYVNPYSLEVTLGDRQLSPAEVRARYQIPSSRSRCYENPATHIIDFVRQYEQTYGRGEHAQVLLTWRRDGHDPEYRWRWPEK